MIYCLQNKIHTEYEALKALQFTLIPTLLIHFYLALPFEPAANLQGPAQTSITFQSSETIYYAPLSNYTVPIFYSTKYYRTKHNLVMCYSWVDTLIPSVSFSFLSACSAGLEYKATAMWAEWESAMSLQNISLMKGRSMGDLGASKGCDTA